MNHEFDYTFEKIEASDEVDYTDPAIYEQTKIPKLQDGQKDRKHFSKIGCCFIALLLLIIGGFLVVGMPFISLWQSADNAALATPTFSPPLSPIPSVPGQAVLGNAMGAFVTKYGQPYFPNDKLIPNSGSISFFLNAEHNNNISDIIVELEPDTSIDTNEVSKLSLIKVAGVVVYARQAWNTGKAGAICNSLLPEDAVYKNEVQMFDAVDGHLIGSDIVYMSKTLAHEFLASDFQDTNQTQTTPGLFDVQYLYGDDTSHIFSCDLELGTTQTIYKK